MALKRVMILSFSKLKQQKSFPIPQLGPFIVIFSTSPKKSTVVTSKNNRNYSYLRDIVVRTN